MVTVKDFRLKGFFKKKNSLQMWKKNHTSLYKEVAGTFSLKQKQKRRLCELRKLFESQDQKLLYD